MPKISLKGQLIPESPIRKLVQYANRTKKKGIHVFHLNIGQPDIETPKEALQAVKQNNIKVLSYTSSNGSESYRKKLAHYYNKHNIHVNEEDILVTTGASEALIFTLAAITDLHDEIIIPEPFYANYNSFAIACGINVIPVTSTLEEGFTLPNIHYFEQKITPKTKAILICNPSNPTGVVYNSQEIEKLKQLALKHDLFLIADEVYREFIYDNVKHHSILEKKGFEQNGVIIDSASKRFSMCGARIGCVVTKNKSLLHTILKMAQSRLSPPSYGLIAAESALNTPENYLNNVVKTYKKRRDILLKALQEIPDVTFLTPKGAFYCMVRLPVKDTDHFAQWLLEHFEDEKQTVMIAPASGFYTHKFLGKKQIRIAYILNEKSLLRSVALLKKALFIYKKLY